MNHYKRLLIFAFAVFVSFSFAQDVPRELVERILGADSEFEFTAGALPDDLPLLLSLPEEVDVVGSLTERYEEASITTLYLEAAERGFVQEDLTARLQLAGLEIMSQGDSWGWGFASNGWPYDRSEFCRDDLLVSVVFYQGAAGATNFEMRLEDLSPERGFDCEQQLDGMRDEHTPPVPVLNAPSDARAFNIDGGHTFSGQYSSVALEAGLDSVALSDHYAAQLEEAGWTHMNSNETSSVVWTQWRFEDDRGSWTGFMQILSDAVFPEQTIAYLFVVQM